MPTPKPRRDSYGSLVPELAAVREQVLLEHPGNVIARQLLHALVEDLCRTALRRGWYGTLTVQCDIVNGELHRDMVTTLERHWRVPGDRDGTG